MQFFTARAGRRSLAQTLVILTAVAALGACADETTAPTPSVPTHAAYAGAPNQGPYTTFVDLGVYPTVTVDTLYGAIVQLGVTCSSNEVFDVIVDLEQEQKVGSTKTRVQGTSTFQALACSEGSAGFFVAISPASGAFQPGRATVRARIANQQSWVEPVEVTRRARVVAGEIM